VWEYAWSILNIVHIVMIWVATIDEVWTGNWIYWALTTHNYNSLYGINTNSHTSKFTTACTESSQSAASSPAPGTGFQWRTPPFLQVPKLCQCLSHSNYWVTVNPTPIICSVICNPINIFSSGAVLQLKLSYDQQSVGQVCLCVGLPSGAHDQIFVFCLTIAGFLMWGALSEEDG
jgi:hypothetical protein